ncbi:MAG: aminopeptidase P N-terminal domain-containing protein, partial [Myxococcales bacterium]|nr:aminopeptidase P N-terminal domain-containing protein [Myxococcales bacterium]
MFAERRQRFLDAIGPGVAVFPAAPVVIRNNDVEHEYRQDSDMQYLSGFEEPESVLVLSNRHPKHRSVLFVRPRDPDREVWDGPRAGVDGAVRDFGVDAAFPIAELDQRLPEYLEDVPRLHYRLMEDAAFDAHVFGAIQRIRGRKRSPARPPSEIVDPTVVLHEMRLHKSADELRIMRRAIEVSRDAHLAAMRVALPGAYEYEVEAEILRVFRAGGSERPAYGSIVGSGPNATVLHYRKNDRRLADGDLLLIDAGCELEFYASDITRTFPVNGRFSDPQKALYEVVLESQLEAIAMTRPGVTLDAIHERVVRVITAGLLRLGLLEGDIEEAIRTEAYKPYYMHRTSHWLGMDV